MMLDWIDRLFNQYMLVRRLLVLWAVALITYAVVKTMTMEGVSGEQIVSLTKVIIGLLAIVIGFYRWSRMRD